MANFLRNFLPYCLKKQADGTYAVLNRGYKPLGFNTSELIDYSDYPVCVEIEGFTAAVAAQVSINGRGELDAIFLYDDETNPELGKKYMNAYLKKLALLAKLRVHPPRNAGPSEPIHDLDQGESETKGSQRKAELRRLLRAPRGHT